MESHVLSRTQRREARRRMVEERPMTVDRFMAKARNAGLVSAGRLYVLPPMGERVEISVNVSPINGVRLSWRGAGKKQVFCDIFSTAFCQKVIIDLGRGVLPTPQQEKR